MAIQLGTIAAVGFPDIPTARHLPLYRELGCTVVQAYRNAKANVTAAQMREALAAGGMPCDSLHGIFGEEFDPSAPDETARRFAVETFRSEGRLCLELGGSLVVVHCCTIRRDGIPAEERLLRVEQLKRSIDDLGRYGQLIGIRYAFENLPGYHPVGWDVKELACILREVGAPNTGMCFDSGHANMVGDVPAAIRAGAEQIIYVHLSDNGGTADDHEMITAGHIDAQAMARAMREVGYAGTMMIEIFHDEDRLRKLIADGTAKKLAGLIDLASGKAR